MEEWRWKTCTRGGVAVGKADCGRPALAGDVNAVNDAVWRTLQRVVPYYNVTHA